MSKELAEATFRKALALEESGDLAAAATEFASATDLDGTDPRFWVSRGVALLQLRHFTEAERCLRTGVALNPHYGEAAARLFLGDALWLNGRRAEAELEWQTVSRMEPTYPGYENPINLAKERLGGRRPT